MKQRPRIYYSDAQKAQMWDRWRKGDSSVQRVLGETGGIRPPEKNRSKLALRLSLLEDGRIRYELKMPYRDGTTHVAAPAHPAPAALVRPCTSSSSRWTAWLGLLRWFRNPGSTSPGSTVCLPAGTLWFCRRQPQLRKWKPPKFAPKAMQKPVPGCRCSSIQRLS